MARNCCYTRTANLKENSYSPYSNFRVGAVKLLAADSDGTPGIKGACIDNGSYGASVFAVKTVVSSLSTHIKAL